MRLALAAGARIDQDSFAGIAHGLPIFVHQGDHRRAAFDTHTAQPTTVQQKGAVMAQFAIFLYAPSPADPMDVTEEEMSGHEAFAKRVAELGGEIVDPQALEAATAAKSIRGGTVSDGTFFGATEVLAGYFLLEAKDLDTAVEIAKAVPTKGTGGVEVRPIFAPPAE